MLCSSLLSFAVIFIQQVYNIILPFQEAVLSLTFVRLISIEEQQFGFIGQKTTGSSENLKIMAQLEEKYIIFISNMPSKMSSKFSIDYLHLPQITNHLHANILLSHILCFLPLLKLCAVLWEIHNANEACTLLFSQEYNCSSLYVKVIKGELDLST